MIKEELYKAFENRHWYILMYETVEGGFGTIDRFRFRTPCSGPWEFMFRIENTVVVEDIMRFLDNKLGATNA